ncbi:MAG TPA: hypothetical protein VFA27_03705 [Vicinamibacterales bacterium]|nr:hypothetical protein [Vicinamibacterales bacterium]
MLIPPPHGLLRGYWRARSSRRTGTPASASVRAAVAPAGPPPTTRTGAAGEEKAMVAKKCNYKLPKLYTVRSVAPSPRLWDSDAPISAHLRFMRNLSQIVRTSMKSGAILVLMLFAASSAEAAHRTHHNGATRRATVARAATLKQFTRTPHSFGGPVAVPTPRLLVGLNDPTTRVTRGTQTDDDDDASAIQNDAPAVQFDLESHGVPLLVPLGLLVRPRDAGLRTGAFCPKSPRGPPLAI